MERQGMGLRIERCAIANPDVESPIVSPPTHAIEFSDRLRRTMWADVVGGIRLAYTGLAVGGESVGQLRPSPRRAGFSARPGGRREKTETLCVCVCAHGRCAERRKGMGPAMEKRRNGDMQQISCCQQGSRHPEPCQAPSDQGTIFETSRFLTVVRVGFPIGEEDGQS